jgi:hypothetical protein
MDRACRTDGSEMHTKYGLKTSRLVDLCATVTGTGLVQTRTRANGGFLSTLVFHERRRMSDRVTISFSRKNFLHGLIYDYL